MFNEIERPLQRIHAWKRRPYRRRSRYLYNRSWSGRRRGCNQHWTLLVNHRSGQHRHLAFNNEIGNDREHCDSRERNTEATRNTQLEDTPRHGVRMYSAP
jgi:hypothetical protein